MFDGIDIVTLPANDIEPLRRLYIDLLDFQEIRQEPVGGQWQAVWGLPTAPTRALLIGKRHSVGGWIRLVEVPGLPPAQLTSRADRQGPLALDFYVRRPQEFERRLESAGWHFLTEAVHYPLPGTDTEVRERMLVQPNSGLLHATVKHRPLQTRCVLDLDKSEDTSEVVACVFVTRDFLGAINFAEEVLGARCYYTGLFAGHAVEQMLALAPGEGFRASLFRGPSSRNARLEFAEQMAPNAATLPPDSVARVVAGCAVDDLDALEVALAGDVYGQCTRILSVEGADGPARRIGLRSRYGASFEFWDREGF